MTVLIDCHTHIERAGISRDNAMRFIDRAFKEGLSEIAFTEHAYNFVESADLLSRPAYVSTFSHGFRVDDYVGLVTGLQDEGYPVKLGIEMDYIDESVEEIAEFLEGYPWDVVLGSVHWIGNWGFDIDPAEFEHKDIDTAYRAYFDSVIRAAKADLFDVLAHPDVIKVFGAKPSTLFSYELADYYDRLTLACADHGVAFEVSSAGLRKPVHEIYPDLALLQMAFDKGVAITMASDAHEPDQVGARFSSLAAYAQSVGYREVTSFSARRPRQMPLG